MLGEAVTCSLCPRVWACRGKGQGPASPTVAFSDLVEILCVNPTSPASDPTVFHKRYLKKIRDLGEVRASGGVWLLEGDLHVGKAGGGGGATGR